MDRIERLKEFLLTDPHDSFTKHALAMEYMAKGDDETARRYLEEVLQQDPAAIGSYYQLGKLLERAGETQLALEWYSKGIIAARAAGEKRAYNELQTAVDDLSD